MTSLLHDQLMNDPRLAQAKQLIMEALKDAQSSLTKTRPSHHDSDAFQSQLKAFSTCRGGPLWYDYLGSGLGNGPYVEMGDGSVKLDLISGIGVHWGHGMPELVEASIDSALQDVVMQGNLQQNAGSASLCEELVNASGLDHCFLTSSGAMANENALKMCFQRHSPANRILAFEHCFMGRTLSIAHITDKAAYRVGLPQTIQTDYIPFYDRNQPEESTRRAVETLHALLDRYPGQYAAMCFELIQGENGYYPGSHDFFVSLMDVLKSHDIAILVDEVQTFGRTESLFAFQHFELEKYVDIVTVGKLLQVCATLYRSDYKPKPGLISQTFTSSTSAIESSRVILRSLLHQGYLGPDGKIARMRAHMVSKLEGLSSTYPEHIQGPFGMGSMIAMTVFGGDKDRVIAFVKLLYERGVIAFIAGQTPMRVRFLMPIGGIEESHIDEAITILDGVIKDCQTHTSPQKTLRGDL